MVASAIRGDETVVCIHDDYCRNMDAAEVARVLLKIGNLVSKACYSKEQTQK